MIGSLVNEIITGPVAKDPEPGMPATICHYSDRNPATVVEVIRFKSGKRVGQVRGVMVQCDGYTLVSGSEQDGSATYEYHRLPDAPKSLYLKDPRGRFTRNGMRLAIGARERYFDPHF